MPLLYLKPIKESPADYDDIEKEIESIFVQEIYLPLIEIVTKRNTILLNTRDDLLNAIQKGQITFYRGAFSGKYDATISKELRAMGAIWDRSSKTYKIAKIKLPVEVTNAISMSRTAFEKVLQKIDEKLQEIIPSQVAKSVNVSKMFNKTLWKVDKSLKKTLKNITVVPQLTESRAERISEGYTENMQLYIKDWTEKEIISLRKKMQKHAFSGQRYEGMIKEIQKSYGSSQEKAKFLARQETALLMTTYKYERYQESGVNEYKWVSVTGTPLHPVRPMHKQLNDRSAKGEIFRFDKPPVDDPNGSRHNPGQNYNCRCTAVPVVRFNAKQ